jgi:hypothetical protein
VAAWQTAKPIIMAFAIGLVAGPIVTNLMGWQVLSGAADAKLRDAIVEQSALFCAQRIRDEVKAPGDLDFAARTALAEKWGIVPGATAADPAVTEKCAFKLAN